jgi:hypothetical protein
MNTIETTNKAATSTEQGAHFAPEKAPSKNAAKPASGKAASAPRAETKGATIIDLIGPREGRNSG